MLISTNTNNLDNKELIRECEELEYKGVKYWHNDWNGEVAITIGFFIADNKSRVSIAYKSNKRWWIIKETPFKVLEAESEKIWTLSLTENNMDKRLEKHPSYKQACLDVREAHNNLIKHKKIQGMTAVGRGRVITYKGMKVELSERKLAWRTVHTADTYMMEGNIKIRLSCTDSFYTQYRYKTKDETVSYWSRNYTANEIEKTKYYEHFKMLRQAYMAMYKQ